MASRFDSQLKGRIPSAHKKLNRRYLDEIVWDTTGNPDAPLGVGICWGQKRHEFLVHLTPDQVKDLAAKIKLLADSWELLQACK